jgi:HlyD family secretion protein
MKERKVEILYSDQVNEIISNPPKKIVRWGTALIFTVFLLLILLAWLIKYPDIIPAPVEITTSNPPVTLVSKITGRINKLYVTDGEKVAAGKLLAVMETAASISEFELLKAVTDSVQNPERLSSVKFPLLSGLGELQIHYASFLKALSDYNTYISNDFYGFKISSISEEINALQEYIARMNVKEKLISENLRLEEKKYNRDSTLFNSKVLSESDYENSKQVYNKSKLSLQEVRLEQSAKTIDMAEKRQLLQDYRIKREEEKQKLASALNENWQNLKAQTRIWENIYLLISPVEGTVTFTKFWSENQSVMTDQPVLSVVPEDAGDFIGRINLNMQRSGKVMISQSVNIKLSGFPYLEYGMVRGKVKSKSLVPSGNAYVIEVALPDGLTTLYGKKLEFTQNMQGTAEILTDDLRLLQKIINPFRHLISKNKNI